jgi:lipopolysaccharide heptosyltransferase II
LRRVARREVRRAAFGSIAVIGAAHRLLRLGRRRREGRAPERILVIRLDLLGDLLFSLPAVEGLRRAYPAAQITMLTLPYTAPLARLHPAVDEVVAVDTNRIRALRGLLDPVTWQGYRRVWCELRERHFDLCVSVHGRMASLCAFLAGPARSVGYADEAYPFMLSDPVAGGRYSERMHEVDYVRRLARHAGARVSADGLDVPVPESARREAEALLREAGIGPGDRVVVVHAGSVNGSAKRWPASYWSRFADAVYARAEARTVLTGAGGDEPIAQRVLAGASSPVVSLVGQTTVEGLVGLIARADLVASGDSGPLHLAVALGRPLVAVYGPTDPRVYGPYHPQAEVQVHRADLPCSPCYRATEGADCPLGDPICMRLVGVEEMSASAVRLLRGGVGER